MSNLINGFEKKVVAKIVDKILSCDKNERRNYLLKLVSFSEEIAGSLFQKDSYEDAKKLILAPDGKWFNYVESLIAEIDHNVLRTTALNLGFEAAYLGTSAVHAKRKEYGFNVPWVILLDPTSACNMRCKGCWAAKYGHNLSLSYETMDRVITEAKELGIRFFIYTGGEPLLRRDDILRLCAEHDDCYFLAFTNGTLVTENFCQEMLEVGNLSLALSLEGFEKDNDARRGRGVNVNEKVYHLTLNLFTTLTAN